MIPPIDPTTLPGPAQKIVSEGAPPKLQMMAAKGIVPGLRPEGILSVLVLLSTASSVEVATQALQTLTNLPEPVLNGALDADLPGAVLMSLCVSYVDRMDVLERLINKPRLPIEAVEHLAEQGNELTVELVSTNEERILAEPQLIELIYMNEKSRMSTANRLIELAVRNDIECSGIPAWKEVALAIQGELIAEPSEEALPADVAFWEHQDLAQKLTREGDEEDAYIETQEGEEELKNQFKPLFQQLAEMSVAERIRTAMLGTREQRLMLIREQNKVVATAAARSPLLKENEVALITRNRGVVVDVLRVIALTPEWMKSYQVKRNLVHNPKTPVALASRLVTQMREADLRRLARNKNVSGAVRTAARRHLDRRKH